MVERRELGGGREAIYDWKIVLFQAWWSAVETADHQVGHGPPQPCGQRFVPSRQATARGSSLRFLSRRPDGPRAVRLQIPAGLSSRYMVRPESSLG
jgi:hypothetical protein